MTTFDFMGVRRIAAAISIVLVIVAIGAIALRGISFGLDFTGGALVEVGFPQPTDPTEIRLTLEENGLANAIVQNYGAETDLIIRIPPVTGVDQSDLGARILSVLREIDPAVDQRRSEFVGPAVGEELTENGGLAMLVALFAVMVYIMLRFTGKFAVGAVTALAHDVILTVGAFALFGWTFNLAELAAVLAVIGYSLNDTIVVSDRIRENFRGVRRGTPVEIINQSLNQTLARTLVTSLTTLMVLLALLFAGGEQISGFATALTVGVVIGTYSSIYVAANVLLAMNITKQDLALPEKEDLAETP